MINIFLKYNQCNVNKCDMMNRNYKYNIENHKQLYGINIINDIQQMTTIQILDKLHCFFIHSYDFGHYGYYEEEKNNILIHKYNININPRGRIINNKYSLNLKHNKKENNIYSFGYQY